MPAISLVSSAIPPGLSLTVTRNRFNLPSAAKPRSITRPNAVVSMFPPHSGTTTLEKNNKTNKTKCRCDILLNCNCQLYMYHWPASVRVESSSPPPARLIFVNKTNRGWGTNALRSAENVFEVTNAEWTSSYTSTYLSLREVVLLWNGCNKLSNCPKISVTEKAT